MRKFTGVKAFYNEDFSQQPMQGLKYDSSKMVERIESGQKELSHSDENIRTRNCEVSKKKAKKLEWKRKQKQAKVLRLKKKEPK